MTGREARHGAAALLLAAGSGERLGGQPKALLRIDGEPLVRRQVRLLSAAGLEDVVVVVGARAAQARAALAGLNSSYAEPFAEGGAFTACGRSGATCAVAARRAARCSPPPPAASCCGALFVCVPFFCESFCCCVLWCARNLRRVCRRPPSPHH